MIILGEKWHTIFVGAQLTMLVQSWSLLDIIVNCTSKKECLNEECFGEFFGHTPFKFKLGDEDLSNRSQKKKKRVYLHFGE